MGCGTCAGVCPVSAIRMDISSDEAIYSPIIDINKCTMCKRCINVCPGVSVDFHKFNNDIFKKQPSESWIGNYTACYIGHTNNHDIRYNASSGGLVTQFLLYLLAKHIITGALITGMNENNPLEPKPFIAKTREEIISASKSKYCSVPVNVCLKEIQDEEGQYAVVGLPCHLHGIRKAAAEMKILNDRIVVYIGLLCSHIVNFNGINFLLKKNGINPDDVTQLSYRGSGWPGGMTILLKNGLTKYLPLIRSWNSYWSIFSSYFFTPNRCMMCPDQTAELSDISMGDAWLPEHRDDSLGKSLIIIRNDYCNELFLSMKQEKIIYLEKSTIDDVMRSQWINIKIKKHDLVNRLMMFKLKGKKTPQFYHYLNPNVSIIQKMRNSFIIFNMNLSTRKKLMKLFVRIPTPLFRLYYGMVKILYIIK